MRLAAFALAAATALSAAPQDQPPAEPEDEIPEPSWRITEDFEVLLQQMQGCWQLVEFYSPLTEITGRQEVAFVLVSNEFLSIEFHLGYFTENRNRSQLVESYFQSGTYRVGVDDRGLLILSTLIGSSFDEFERLIFERPGLRRAFVAVCEEDKLTLTRQNDGTRYVFERVKSLLKRDFFGRPVRDESLEGGEEPGAAGGKRRGR